MGNAHIHVYTVFEITFCSFSGLTSLFFIIMYLIIRKDLNSSNYFRLQLMIAILIESILRFIREYEETNNEINKNTQIIAYFKSIIEFTILLFIFFFTLLLYLTLKKKAIYESQKRLFVIGLSLLSWFIPSIYLGIFCLIYKINKNNNNNTEDIMYERENKYWVFRMKSKIIADFVVVGFLLIIDILLFVLILIENSRKKTDADESMSEDQDSHSLKIIATFIIQIFFFCVNILDNIDLICQYYNPTCWIKDYRSNLCYLFFLAFVSGIYAFDYRVYNFLKEKVLKCIGLKKTPNTVISGGRNEDEDGLDDYDEQGDIYIENKDGYNGGLISSPSSGRNSAFNQ